MFEEVDEGHSEGEEKIVFRYNREERLKNAPQIVKDAYEGKLKPVRGIKIFWVYKQNRFILLALVLFIAFVWIYTALNNTRSNAVINGISFDLTAFAYEEEIYSSLKINNKSADDKTPPVKIEAEFEFINVDNQVVEKKELSLVYSHGEQSLATKMTDYDIIRVDVVINSGNTEKVVSAPVKR